MYVPSPMCEADETPVPNVFLVDDDTGIGMGSATMSLMAECSTTALVGWDLCAEAASTGTALRGEVAREAAAKSGRKAAGTAARIGPGGSGSGV